MLIASTATTRFIYIYAIAGSLLLSIWLCSDAVINSDGILYLQVAQLYKEQGWGAAADLYPWPFYSIFIAWTQTITSLSFQNAAYVLNALLCVLIVTSFIHLVSVLGGGLQEKVLAAVIILLHTGLNDYRDYIIRDLGHWAFMLYGLLFLILYAQHRQLRYAIGFGLAMCIAFLFRTEAIFVLMLAPLVLGVRSDPKHSFSLSFRPMLGAYTIVILVLVAAMCAYFIAQVNLKALIFSNPWLSHLQNIDFLSSLNQQFNLLRPDISSNMPDNHVYYFLIGGFAIYFLVRLFMLLSPLYSLLLIYAIKQHVVESTVARTILGTYIVIYSTIVLGFLYYHFFLSGRYIMPIVLLLSLWVPYALGELYNAWRNHKPGLAGKPWCFPIVVLGLIYMLGDSLISSTDW